MFPIAIASADYRETFNVICKPVPDGRSGSPGLEVAGAGDRVPAAGGEPTGIFGLRPVCGPGGFVGHCVGCGFGDCSGTDGLRGYDGFGGIERIDISGFAIGFGDLA
jgi:hypothetical protein